MNAKRAEDSHEGIPNISTRTCLEPSRPGPGIIARVSFLVYCSGEISQLKPTPPLLYIKLLATIFSVSCRSSNLKLSVQTQSCPTADVDSRRAQLKRIDVDLNTYTEDPWTSTSRHSPTPPLQKPCNSAPKPATSDIQKRQVGALTKVNTTTSDCSSAACITLQPILVNPPAPNLVKFAPHCDKEATGGVPDTKMGVHVMSEDHLARTLLRSEIHHSPSQPRQHQPLPPPPHPSSCPCWGFKGGFRT